MAYYKTCPHCGANLDPGETCDCVKEPTAEELRDYTIKLLEKMTDVHMLRIAYQRMSRLFVCGSCEQIDTKRTTEYLTRRENIA